MFALSGTVLCVSSPFLNLLSFPRAFLSFAGASCSPGGAGRSDNQEGGL